MRIRLIFSLAKRILKSNFFVCSLLLVITGRNNTQGQNLQADFVTNGNTIKISDSCFQLTSEQNFNGGSIWYKVRIDLNYDFEVKASINLGRLDGSGADGIAFVIQPLSNTIGGRGGGLGYSGVSPSLAVEFDTWTNNDPWYDHIALVKNGDLNHYISPGSTLQGPFEMLPNQANAEDNTYRPVVFKWEAVQKRFTAYYNGVKKIDYTGDIINEIFSGNPFVYWGFTAATGGAINYQTVCIAGYSAIKETECPPLTITSKLEYCIGDTIKLYTEEAISYQWSGPNSFTSNAQNPTIPKAKIQNSGAYTLIVENKCNEKDTATINIQIIPNTNIFSSDDTTVTFGNSIQLNPLINSNITSYEWSPVTSLSCSNCINPIATPVVPTEYTVKIKTQNGCISYDTIMVNLNCLVDILSPSAFCEKDTLILSADQAKSYLWSGPNNFSSSSKSAYIPGASKSESGTYSLITNTNTYCADTNYIDIDVLSLPKVNAGKDTTISMGATFRLNPTVDANTRLYKWGPSTYLSCTQCQNPNSSPTQQISYTLTVTDGNGCSSTDSVMISVTCSDKNYFIPNTFSPNGDGMNDYFYPRGGFIEKVIFLRVFNRWGEKVFEQNDFSLNDKTKGWNGKYKGKIVDTGVFAYTIQMICFNGETIDLKGSIMVLQ